MLLEMAIGDAYGAGMEYAPLEFIRQNNTLQGYCQNPTYKALLPGRYTDDTQMTLAIAEALVEGVKWTREELAKRFVVVFRRDPRPGYARGFQSFLEQVENGEEFLAKIRPSSDKSGAAMRSAPLGLLPSLDEVITHTKLQAALTHNTPDGINAALATALMTHYFVWELGPKAHVGRWLEQHVAGQWATPWEGEVGSKGWMSVRAAITAIVEHDSLATILEACVAFGGDVDTVATIAMGAASQSREVELELPQALLEGLESGAYGRGYLDEIDKKLAKRFGTMRRF